MNETLNKLKNKKVTIFLNNDFRYTGTITNIDNIFITIHDQKTNQEITIAINSIKTIKQE